MLRENAIVVAALAVLSRLSVTRPEAVAKVFGAVSSEAPPIATEIDAVLVAVKDTPETWPERIANLAELGLTPELCMEGFYDPAFDSAIAKLKHDLAMQPVVVPDKAAAHAAYDPDGKVVGAWVLHWTRVECPAATSAPEPEAVAEPSMEEPEPEAVAEPSVEEPVKEEPTPAAEAEWGELA